MTAGVFPAGNKRNGPEIVVIDGSSGEEAEVTTSKRDYSHSYKGDSYKCFGQDAFNIKGRDKSKSAAVIPKLKNRSTACRGPPLEGQLPADVRMLLDASKNDWVETRLQHRLMVGLIRAAIGRR